MNRATMMPRPAEVAALPPRAAAAPVRPGVIVAALLVALGVLIHGEMLSFEIIGFDGYPMLESARVRSAADFAAIFTMPLMRGEYFAQGFFRPVHDLFFALGYAYFGAAPAGQQLVTMAVFAASILLMWRATRRMLGGTWAGPLAATMIYLLHPAQIAILPITNQRHDLLAVTFLLATLAALPLPGEHRRIGRLLLAGFFSWAAAGSKEIGVIAVGLTVLHQFFFSPAPPGRMRRVAGAMLAAIPSAAGVAIYLVNRWLVLGGAGGYHTEDRLVSQFARFAPVYLRDALNPIRGIGEGGRAGTLAAEGALLVLVLLACGAGWRRPNVADGTEMSFTFIRARGRFALIAIGTLWIISNLVLASLSYVPYFRYAMVLMTGFSLIVAAGVDAAAALRRSVAASVGFAAAATLFFFMCRESPAWSDFPEFRYASRMQAAYLWRVSGKLDMARPGDTVVETLVSTIAPNKSREATMLQTQSVLAWRRLNYPTRRDWRDRSPGPRPYEIQLEVAPTEGSALVERAGGYELPRTLSPEEIEAGRPQTRPASSAPSRVPRKGSGKGSIRNE